MQWTYSAVRNLKIGFSKSELAGRSLHNCLVVARLRFPLLFLGVLPGKTQLHVILHCQAVRTKAGNSWNGNITITLEFATPTHVELLVTKNTNRLPVKTWYPVVPPTLSCPGVNIRTPCPGCSMNVPSTEDSFYSFWSAKLYVRIVSCNLILSGPQLFLDRSAFLLRDRLMAMSFQQYFGWAGPEEKIRYLDS